MEMRKRLLALGLAAGFTFSGGAAAMAVTAYPAEGGTWNYGLAAVRAYSDYLHPSRCHGSTVQTDWGSSRSPNVAPGAWANAAHNATPWTNNNYFYRVC